jgi:hypothetical protein
MPKSGKMKWRIGKREWIAKDFPMPVLRGLMPEAVSSHPAVAKGRSDVHPGL